MIDHVMEIIYFVAKLFNSQNQFSMINIYFRLRFGLANAIDDYQRLKIQLCVPGIFNL